MSRNNNSNNNDDDDDGNGNDQIHQKHSVKTKSDFKVNLGREYQPHCFRSVIMTSEHVHGKNSPIQISYSVNKN